MQHKINQLVFLKSLYLQRMCGETFENPINRIQSNSPLQAFKRDSLKESIAACNLCSCAKMTQTRLGGFISPACNLCFITPAPLVSSSDTVPDFIQNKSAQMLQNIIKGVYGLQPKECSILSLLKCPLESTPTHEQINACIPFLQIQLDSIKPKVIVVFGSYVGEYLIGGNSDYGRILWHNGRSFLFTFGLNEIIRNPSLKTEVMRHLLVAKEVL